MGKLIGNSNNWKYGKNKISNKIKEKINILKFCLEQFNKNINKDLI